VAGVKRVEVTVQDHLQTDEINTELLADLA
jgi:hypothetical protein